jgi:CRP/FNR family transcriptional regulator
VPDGEFVVPKGTVIFRQGDLGDSMFLIRRGRVRILLEYGGHVAAVAVLEAGAFFGELSLLSEATRSATAEAAEDTTLLVIRRDVFAMMMQDDIDVVFSMLHTMGERLGRTDRQFRDVLERHCRVRLLVEGLGGVRAPHAPVVLEVERLAADLQLDGATVRAIVGEFVEQGAGMLQDGRWQLEAADHIAAAVTLLRTYAQAPGGQSG